MTSRNPGIFFLIATLLLLGGCATEVVVRGQVPKPLGDQLPVTAALVLDGDFKSYSYREEGKGKRKVSFGIGQAQADMFRTITKSLFREVIEVDVVSADKGTLSLYPKVDEIQLATPFDNQLKVFEVWIRYNLRVFDDEGDLLADWIMTAYGKTPTRFLGSDEEALNQAAMVALRDAGARLTLELTRVPEIRQWLDKTGGSESL